MLCALEKKITMQEEIVSNSFVLQEYVQIKFINNIYLHVYAHCLLSIQGCTKTDRKVKFFIFFFLQSEAMQVNSLCDWY